MLGKSRTLQEQARITAIHERGCVPCWLESQLQNRKYKVEPCDIHHVDQTSHMETYGNCPWHHRGVPKFGFDEFRCRNALGPSMAREPAGYKARYGSEVDLLAYQTAMLLKLPHEL